MKQDYINIRGWLKPEGAELLDECARKSPNANYFEIGTFLGRSASVLGNVAKERGGILTCVDCFHLNQPFNGDNSITENTLYTFRENMKQIGLSETVVSIKGNSENILPIVKGKFGMIYIDAGHTEKYTILESEWAYQNIAEGGYICFHDYENYKYPDIKMVVDRFLISKKLTIEKRADSLIAIKVVNKIK